MRLDDDLIVLSHRIYLGFATAHRRIVVPLCAIAIVEAPVVNRPGLFADVMRRQNVSPHT